MLCLQFLANNNALATNACSDLFSKAAVSDVVLAQPADLSLTDRADRLERRLEWFERRQNQYGEGRSVKPLIERLREFGSPLDFDILETAVSALEASGGVFRTKPTSSTNPAIRGTNRPDSQLFRNRDWDLEYLGNYFFSSPSTFAFSKRQDLAYLKHVLRTAQRSSRGTGLNEVVLAANRSWHLSRLKKIVPLHRKYLAWEAGKTREALQDEFIARANEWIHEANSPGELANREKYLKHTIDSLKNDWSTFDLYVLSRYFDVIRKLKPSIDSQKMIIDRDWQMTDWRVLEFGLSGGSLDYVKTFLDQVSHDTDRKIVLLRVLDKMATAHEAPFATTYRRAFEALSAEMADLPAPKQFTSDLHVFTVFGSTGFLGKDEWTPRGLLYNPKAVHVVAAWNPKLGRLESNVIQAIPINDVNSTLVSTFPEIRPLVSRYFDALREQKGTLTEQQVDAQETRELNAKLTRTTFFIAMERGKFSADEMLAMSRIFYGGPRFLGWLANPRPMRVGGEKTYIEEDFPNLLLPERIDGKNVYELGRLLATQKAAPNTRVGMVQFMADYFLNTGAQGSAYMDGGRAVTKLYEKMGAQIVAGPDQLNLPQGYKPIWVLNVPISQMTRDYAPSGFESVQQRNAEDHQP